METQQKEALINQVKQRFQLMAVHLSEKDKRIWAASEANTRLSSFCLLPEFIDFFPKANFSSLSINSEPYEYTASKTGLIA